MKQPSYHTLGNIQCILAESPVWSNSENTLYWVDINDKKLYRYNIVDNKYQSWKTPGLISSIAIKNNQQLIAAIENRLALIQLPEFDIEYLTKPFAHDSSLIFNDGKFDQNGRFWIGTRDLTMSETKAALYCYENGFLHEVLSGFIVANGMEWCDNHFFLTDTIQKKIFQYDFNLTTGELANQNVYADFSQTPYFPDGLCKDNNNQLWSALWGSGKICCLDNKGKIVNYLTLPAKNVTSCCFVNSLNKFFITSASIDFNNAVDIGEKAGFVFSVDL